MTHKTKTSARDALGRVSLEAAPGEEDVWPLEGRGVWLVTYPDGHTVTVPTTDGGDAYARALGMLGLSRPHGLNPAISALREFDDMNTGDRWAVCMSYLWAVSTLLWATGGAIPDGVGYSPSWGQTRDVEAIADVDGTSETGENEAGADYVTASLARDYLAGDVTGRSLELAAVALHRWADVLKAAGQDY